MPTRQESRLRQIPLFGSLGGADIGLLGDILHEVRLPAGVLLFQEGDLGDCFYVLLEGEVEVVKALGTNDERVLALRCAGEFFGEMSLFEPGGLRTASIRTRTPVCLLQMARSDFDRLLHQRPDVGYEMVRVLSLRLNNSHNATIADLREKNRQLAEAYEDLKAAQAQIIEKERLEKELETAHWIQQSILPHSLPTLPGFDLGAILVPARAVGGDLYDFIPLPGDALGIVIGDVSDKGVPAAIFMALTYSLLRAEALRWASPAQVLKSVNGHLIGMNDAGMFVTVLYGVLHGRERRFTYARAGHDLPIQLDGAGNLVEIQHDSGNMLGVFDVPDLDEQTVHLEPGGLLLLSTDGATDVTNELGQRLGRARLEALVQANRHGGAQAVCGAVWAGLAEFQGSSPQFDDAALIAIQAAK
jgi:phosphoserine phosphatase RsbU/P